MPTEPEPTSWVCPECEQGKHRNCNGTAWDFDADELVPCGCTESVCGQPRPTS